MGEWRAVKTLYGPREQWTPSTPGDWPTAAPGWIAPPPPCERCGGKLQRFTATVGGIDDARWRQMVRRWEILGKPDPAPVRPEPTTQQSYAFAHFRDCLPSAVTTLDVELRPPRRV